MTGPAPGDSSPPGPDGGLRPGELRAQALRVLIRIEALKTTRRLAFRVTTGIFAAVNAIFVAKSVGNSIQSPHPAFSLPAAWPEILQVPANIGPFFLGVTMILLFAPEFSWRTARQNVIDGLSKERFYAGKLILLAILVAIFLALPIAIGGAGALVSLGESGSPLIRLGDFNYMLACGLGLLLWGSGAFMLAALLRSSGPAMGILFVYLLVEKILSQLLADASEALHSALVFLPVKVFESLADRRLHYPEMIERENAMRAEQGRPLLEYQDFWLLACVALAYSAFFLAAAFLNMRRRDL